MRKVTTTAIVLLVFVLCCGYLWAAEIARVEDRILVRFKKGIAASDVESIHRSLKTSRLKRFDVVKNLDLIRLPTGTHVDAALEAFRKNPAVLYAEPDYRVRALEIPNDPAFTGGEQWALLNTGQYGGLAGADIRALEAWDVSIGSRSVVVAVIDTGVNCFHPDLAANMWRNPWDCNDNGIDDEGNGYVDDCFGANVVDNDGDPINDGIFPRRSSHGTHVSGIIGAQGNNGEGIAGVNWDISMVVCRFLDDSGGGTISGAISCLQYVKDLKRRGVNIVATNNSWGGSGFSQALYDAIDEHRREGILFVASAGNESDNNDAYPVFPAGYPLPNVISVASTDRTDALSLFSNSGRHTVHIGAPGSEIVSTVLISAYGIASGTSMAAPFVTGAAALLKAANPALDWKAIKNRILAGGNPLPSLRNTVTSRRLDLYGALTCTNSVVLARMAPFGRTLLVRSGEAVNLSALHINCGEPNGTVSVVVEPEGKVIILRDDGVAPDLESGDGIYAGLWVPDREGLFALRFPDDDEISVRVASEGSTPTFRPLLLTGLGLARPDGVTVGDVDGDGRNDVVVATSGIADPTNDRSVHVFRQDEKGGLVHAGAYRVEATAVMSRLRSVSLGDMNNDGRTDVVVSHVAPESPSDFNYIAVFYQNPWGKLDAGVKFPTPNSYRLALGDFNGDGLTDVAGVGFDGGTCDVSVDVFLQNGGGTLDPPARYAFNPVRIEAEKTLQGFGCLDDVDIQAGDVNGDGRSDLVVLLAPWHESNGPVAALLLQREDGTMDPPVYLAAGLMKFVGGVGIGDVNGDGLNDILVAYGIEDYQTWKPYLGLFARDAAGRFMPFLSYSSFDRPLKVVVADMDLDGRNDAVVASERSCGIFFQAPNGSLFPYMTVGEMDGLNGLAVGDVNGDGAPDVVASGFPGGLRVLYGAGGGGTRTVRLTVIVGGAGRGIIAGSPSAISCSEDRCSFDLPLGAWVTLSAQPVAGSHFGGWRGASCRAGEPDGRCSLAMDRDRAVAADFYPDRVRLRVGKAGTGGGRIVEERGPIDCGTACSAEYPTYTIVTLKAIADDDSLFLDWRGANCSVNSIDALKTCVIDLPKDRSVDIVFMKRKTLTIINTGKGSGRVDTWPNGAACESRCSFSYPQGTPVKLDAVAAGESGFFGFEGGGCGLDSRCIVVLDNDITVSAQFDKTMPLWVHGQGLGLGMVTSAPSGIECGIDCWGDFLAGSEVTLTAVASPGSLFTGWSGGGCSGTGNCVVTMDGYVEVTAAFIACTYTMKPVEAVFPHNGKDLSVVVKVKAVRQPQQAVCPEPVVAANQPWVAASLEGWADNEGTVHISVDTNGSSVGRDATVSIGTLPFAVTQRGVPCVVTKVKPASRTFPRAGGTGVLTVTATATDCPWSAATTVPWLHIVSVDGSGSGDVLFFADANGDNRVRSGKIEIIQGQTPTKKKISVVRQTR